jgi:thioredoxin reductase (NADPH)
VDVFGSDRMEGVKIKNNKTGEETDLPAGGLFYAIGHTPNTDIFTGQLKLDKTGYIATEDFVKTNVEGVYAVGDVQDHEFRQAVTAAGSGCMGAMLAERWLAEHNLAQEFSQQEEEAKSQETETEDVADTEETFDLNATHHVGGFALRKLYHESDRLIMVKYASPTCGPCHTLKPILQKVVDGYDGKIHYVEIDIEQEPEIAENAGIVGTPTIQFFKDKGLVKELKGVKRKSEYRETIEANM